MHAHDGSMLIPMNARADARSHAWTPPDARCGVAVCLLHGVLMGALLLHGAHAATGGRAPPLPSAEQARTLHKWAEQALGDSSVESRQRATRDLEEAIRLEPENAEHWMLLGRLRTLGEFDLEALTCFRRAVVLDRRNVSGYLELGMGWKRQWLRGQDSLALLRAIGCFDTLATLRPRGSDAWLRLVPLLYERGDLEGAAAAAAKALAGRPRRAEAGLAAAYVAYRRGEIERADNLFRATLPRLDPELRRWFDDPGLQSRASSGGNPWAGLDPDPTTPENEFQLEYCSRVAHSFLLFYDPARPGLDARAETYIRYGPPLRVMMNPPDVPLFFRASDGSLRKPPMDYPTPVMAWYYPELGMRVVLQDRSLHGRYTPQATRDFDPTSVPNPRLLAASEDLEALNGGFMVLPKRPPRSQRLEVAGVVARFEGNRGPRLFAQVEAPGAPSDTLSACWVVIDSAGRVLVRETQPLAPAGCHPADRREAQFMVELPAGAYQVAISVRDSHNRRGLFQTRGTLEPSPPPLALSDLVPVCNEPSVTSSSTAVRFDIDTEARLSGARPFTAYLEIYHLTPALDGLSRFQYDCEVRRETRTRAKEEPTASAALISTSRQDAQIGSLRRQFVSVPTGALPPGRYRVEVRVHDLVAGTAAERVASFVRE